MARKKERPENDDLLPDEKCPEHLVDELVALHYDRETVVRWSGAKARAKLSAYKRETGIASSRADAAAQRIDGTTFPPPMPERLEGAAFLGAMMGGTDDHDLGVALKWAIDLLAADERLRLATYLIARLKTVPELPQSGNLLGGKSAPVRAGTDRGTGAGGPADRGVEF
jgi:hypothetical protein